MCMNIVMNMNTGIAMAMAIMGITPIGITMSTAVSGRCCRLSTVLRCPRM
jgi:hypothetical protein